MQPSVGIVGIGNMGLGMALRLRERGYPVGVRDLDAAREHAARLHGAAVHADAAAVAQRCELLIVAVVDAAQTESVLFGERGAVHGLARGATVMLCPTLAPQTIEDCAAKLAGDGVQCIDAPMSEIVARTGWPCALAPSANTSHSVQGQARLSGASMPRSFSTAAILAGTLPAWLIPVRSPLTSAMNTGTPRRLKFSASVCSVIVLPVPVAPVISP